MISLLLGAIYPVEQQTPAPSPSPSPGPDSSRDAQLVLEEELKTLIVNHSFTMDPSPDQELILTRFRVLLGELARTNHTSYAFSDALINLVVVGVYRLRAHVIKDRLSSGQHQTVRWNGFQLPWSTDLLLALVQFRNATARWEEYKGGGACDEVGVASTGEACPLDLATRLGMLDVLRLLVQERGKMCDSTPSSGPLQCTNALHLAVTNQDAAAVDYIMEQVGRELAGNEEGSDLCALLTCDRDSLSGRSPLNIARHQCSHGLRCEMFHHLSTLVHTYCSQRSHRFPSNQDLYMSHDLRTCLKDQHNSPSPAYSAGQRLEGCVLEGRGCKFEGLTGHWQRYEQHRVGRMNCDLTRVSAGTITPQEFERDFVNMR